MGHFKKGTANDLVTLEIAGMWSEAPSEQPPLDLLATLAVSPMEVLVTLAIAVGRNYGRGHIL